jgi:hemoglobin
LNVYFKNTNWEKHLPIMYSFWENIAFSSSEYSGNPMEKHQHLHQIHPISTMHFERWMELYTQNMNELFEGPNATLLILRAANISKIMLSKLIS